MTMTDLSDERTVKITAIRKARNGMKPTFPADHILAFLDANLARIKAAIDALPATYSTD